QDSLVRFQRVEASEVSAIFLEMLWVVVRLAAPVAAVALVVGIASQLVQVGFLAASDPLKPQLERINPVSGFKRIFSKRALVESVKAVLKVTVVGLLAYSVVRESLPAYLEYMQMDPAQASIHTGQLILRLVLWISVSLLFLALFDYMYQRWE